MAYIEGHAREQALLLLASVEDYVAAENPVRFIDAFVDDLDLGDAASFDRGRRRRGDQASIRATCSSCTCTAILTGCDRAGVRRQRRSAILR